MHCAHAMHFMEAKNAFATAGGRITGFEVITELIKELHASAEQAERFEGEMRMLAGYARFDIQNLAT